MRIGDNNLPKFKEEIIMKSLLWNSVIEVFKQEKSIDISEKMISIKKNSNTFIITTNNPLIKQEFLYIEDKVGELFHKKLSKMLITSENFIIKMK